MDTKRGRPAASSAMKANEKVIRVWRVLMVGVLLLGGCQDLLRPRPFSADIRRIAVFHATNPWVNFDQATFPKPEGIKFSFYLIDGKTQRGIFADGTCVVELWASDPADKSGSMALAREWRIPMNEVPRGGKETPLGLGYSLRLDWRPLDLEGQPIELRVKLEQPNGNVIQSQLKRLDVMRSRPAQMQRGSSQILNESPANESDRPEAGGGSKRRP